MGSIAKYDVADIPARGSARVCAAGLDVLVAKNMMEESVMLQETEILLEIVSMLVGLIRSNSPNRDVQPVSGVNAKKGIKIKISRHRYSDQCVST